MQVAGRASSSSADFDLGIGLAPAGGDFFGSAGEGLDEQVDAHEDPPPSPEPEGGTDGSAGRPGRKPKPQPGRGVNKSSRFIIGMFKMCELCEEDTDDWGKKRFCRLCMQDVECAERRAKADKEKDFYDQIIKDIAAFRSFIAQFRKETGP